MWFKVDDGLHDHKKTRGLDCAAVGLWAMAGSWCGQHKTNGFVPASVVPRWSKAWKRLAAELVTRGLWERADQDGEDGWMFVNWTEYQPTQQETDVPLERLRWRRKNALKKDRDLCEFVVRRDRGCCRYCGTRVNWQDRKSPKGGTYDHIDPDGDNSRENVVVACRRCNGRKRDRTPHEAGMTLLPEPKPYDLAPDQAPEEPDIQRSAPERSSAIKGLARETVRDQVGTGSVRVGSRPVELGQSQTNGSSNGSGAHA